MKVLETIGATMKVLETIETMFVKKNQVLSSDI